MIVSLIKDRVSFQFRCSTFTFTFPGTFSQFSGTFCGFGGRLCGCVGTIDDFKAPLIHLGSLWSLLGTIWHLFAEPFGNNLMVFGELLI